MIVKLRAPEPDDVDLIYVWDNDETDSHTSLTVGPLSRHQIARYVDEYDGDIFRSGSQRFMIEADGETVGTIDIFDFDRRARRAFVGIYISPRYRRRGIGRAALDSVSHYVADNLSMHTLAAIVAIDNEASQRLFASAGYTTSGRLRSWLVREFERVDAFILQRDCR